MTTKFLQILAISSLILTGSDAFAKSPSEKKKKLSVEEELKFSPGDETGNEMKALKAELLIGKTEEKALQQLNKLLKKYKGTAMEATLQDRLAEIYMKRAKTATFFEINRGNKNVVQFSPVATKNETSKGWIRKATSTWSELEKKFKHYTNLDLVHFNHAFALQLLGQDTEAQKHYRIVIDEFSESPLVPDSLLALGEALFNEKKFEAAYEEFQKIRKFNESRVYPYGLYKGSWALYNLRRTEDALKQMEEVVTYSKAYDGENKLDVSREALEDMVVFYEDVRGPSEAVSYFRKWAGDQKAGELLLKLGRVYFRHGKFKNQEIVYTELINRVPESPEHLDMRKDLMDGFDIGNSPAVAVQNLEYIADLCNEKSNWSKKQKPEIRNQCWGVLEESGKTFAGKWHKKYNKSNEKLHAEVALRAYKALMTSGRPFKDLDKALYSYAELLFQLKDYRLASESYFQASRKLSDKKLVHDSSYGAIVALEKAVNDKWLDKDEREFRMLAQNYIDLNPKGQYLTDIKFKKAFIAYEKNRYDESAPQLKDLAIKFSDTERGRKAATLYLDILNIQKKFVQLRDESYEFAKSLKLDDKTKSQFQVVHQQATFTVVQEMESKEKYQDAINGYLKFVKDNPKSEYADKALFNSIRCANLDGDLVLATKLIERLTQDYPKSTHKNEMLLSLVTIYEAQAQLGDAAKTYLVLAQNFPDKKWKYIVSAGDYFILNNDWSKGAQAYKQVIDGANGKPEWMEAQEKLLIVSEKNDNKAAVHKTLELLAQSGKQPQASLASLKLTQEALAKKGEDDAFKLAKKTVSMKNEKGVSTWAVASARLIQAKILANEFERSSVKARADKLATVLAIKTEKLEKAQKAFQDVIAIGDRSAAVEALLGLAQCYGNYAGALKGVNVTGDIPEAEKAKLQSELENMALPIEDKYFDTLKLALKEAKNLKLHDGIVERIQDSINKALKRGVASQTVWNIRTPDNMLPKVK